MKSLLLIVLFVASCGQPLTERDYRSCTGRVEQSFENPRERRVGKRYCHRKYFPREHEMILRELEQDDFLLNFGKFLYNQSL